MTAIYEILQTANFTSLDGSCSYGASDAFRKIADVLSTHGFQLRIEAIDSSTMPEHFDHRILLESESSLTTSVIVTYVLLSFLCLVGAAIAAGLTQGMLSLSPLELKVKLETGTEAEKTAARRILPIISEHHILLVTLMLFNACANEALPIFLDALVPSWLSIVMAVTLVLICGEIVPSAIFTGPKQLEIASFLAPLTKCLIFVLYPISYPTGCLLDAWLGHDDGITVFDRREMAAVVDIMHSEGRLESNRDRRMSLMQSDQVNIMKGALNYIDMSAADVMSKIDDIFMLPIDCSLNVETVSAIFQSGYSRIPVYEGTRDEIYGLLLVKDLVFIDPEDEIPLKNFIKYFGRPIITVWGDDKLGMVLSLFKKKRSHLAIVHSVDNSRDGDPVYVNVGLITLEDVIEEILGDEIEDEHDVASPEKHAAVLLQSRDMDHIRLTILGSVDVAADKTIDPKKADSVAKLLKGMPEFSGNLLSHVPIEREGHTFEENLQWKIESSTVNCIHLRFKYVPVDCLK
jgi:metal transporter CNNM